MKPAAVVFALGFMIFAIVASARGPATPSADMESRAPGVVNSEVTFNDGVTFNAGFTSGFRELPTDGGRMGNVNDVQVTSALPDGSEVSYCLGGTDSNCTIRPYSESDGAGGVDEMGLEYQSPNGAVQFCTSNDEVLTFAGGGGEASKVTSGLIPDGATGIGVTARVLVAGTTCTSADYGDGSDVDLYGDNVAVTADTTLTPADHTANIPYNTIAAEEVTITGVGGNCVSLSVRVEAFFCTYTGPTQ